MSDEQQILSADDGLSFADQLDFMTDILGPIKQHKATIAGLHPRGAEFVGEVVDAVEGFTGSLSKMDKEVVEADQAQGAHTGHQDAILVYLLFVLSKLDVIEALGEEPPDTIRALNKAYGVTGNRLSLKRRSHQLRRLTQMVGAHKVHGALLKKYRVTQEQLDEGEQLLDTLPGFSAKLAKELSEKEVAVKAAHAAESLAVDLVNKVFVLARDARGEQPALFNALASATAKHRAKLQQA